MPRLAIRLIGPLRVVIQGTPVPNSDWQGRIPRTIVQLLALSARGKSQEELIELLWPDHPLDKARRNLYVAMSRVRHALARSCERDDDNSGPIVTTVNGYRLADWAWVDIREFHAGVARIRRLRTSDPGAALMLIMNTERIEPDSVLAEHSYDDWALSARERARDDALLLEEIRTQLLLERERLPEALEALQFLLKLDPTREEAARRAIDLAGRLHDRALARQIFAQLQKALADDIGVEPTAETVELYEAVAGQQVPAARVEFPVDPRAPVAGDRLPIKHPRMSGPGRALLGHPPAFLTRFIGREQELTDVVAALQESRLLTVRGMGGVGKTRLAFEAARHVTNNYAHGVWWVDLSTVTDGRFALATAAQALGVPEEAGRPLLETACEILQPFELLLILDNCEHVSVDVARFVAPLLAACPGVTIVATSQVMLGLAGETLYQVPALSGPEVDKQMGVDELLRSEAVRLFVDRAGRARPGLRLTNNNAEAVVRICRRLDGIPLAIELAAARLGTLTPAQLADRLDRRFHVLRGTHIDGPGRHRSLQALVDWSYDILPDPERRLWERLSVFVGSISVEAAEFVGDGLVLDALTGLVNRSIIMCEPYEDGMRYRLSETMREYGLMKVNVRGDEDETRRAHRDWCLGLVTQVEAANWGEGEPQWMRRLGAQYGEIRAAFDWSVTRGDGEVALTFAASLWWFWVAEGRMEEGLSYIEQALSLSENRSGKLYALALHAAAALHMQSGNVDVAASRLEASLELLSEADAPREVAVIHLTLGQNALALADGSGAVAAFEKSLALFTQLGDETGMAPALWHAGNVALQQGNIGQAKHHYYESLALCRKTGFQRGEAACLAGLGLIGWQAGHVELAVRTLREALSLCRQLHDYMFSASILDFLGWMARQRGDFDEADTLHRESLALRWKAKDRQRTAHSLRHLAHVAAAQRLWHRAARLFGAEDGWRPRGGSRLPPESVLPIDDTETIAVVKSALGEAVWKAEWEAGKLMSPERIVKYALGDPDGRTAATVPRDDRPA